MTLPTPQLIPALNPGALTGRGNNTYLIGTTLIDAGVGVPEHVDAIAAALEGAALTGVILTHGHSDHTKGVPALLARWPGLRVAKWFPGGVATAGWQPLREGDVVVAGTSRLRVIETPGHAADHVCLFDDITGDLFAGDMVIAGTTVLVPPREKGGSMRDYLASLARLRDLDAARILPGHGPAVDRPRERIATIIEHRLMREAQVVACLNDGLTEPRAIVDKLYEGLPEALVAFAELNVRAHIEKIRDDQAG
jgi:glyoxylase-like metal-dependent hydrolase (beta-lactamase superfamily II)